MLDISNLGMGKANDSIAQLPWEGSSHINAAQIIIQEPSTRHLAANVTSRWKYHAHLCYKNPVLMLLERALGQAFLQSTSESLF